MLYLGRGKFRVVDEVTLWLTEVWSVWPFVLPVGVCHHELLDMVHF